MDQFSETKPELWENTSIKFFYLIWKIELPITSVIFRGLLRSKNVQLFNKNRFCSIFPDRTSDFFSVLNVIRMLPSCCPGNNQWRTDTAAFAAQLTLTDRPGSCHAAMKAKQQQKTANKNLTWAAFSGAAVPDRLLEHKLGSVLTRSNILEMFSSCSPLCLTLLHRNLF